MTLQPQVHLSTAGTIEAVDAARQRVKSLEAENARLREEKWANRQSEIASTHTAGTTGCAVSHFVCVNSFMHD